MDAARGEGDPLYGLLDRHYRAVPPMTPTEPAVAEVVAGPYFTFVHPGSGVDTVTLGREPDDQFRRNNFDLCRAVDMTSLAVVLERMVKQGWMDKRDAELFGLQASALRAQLVTANNKAFTHLLAKEPRP